MTKVPLSTSGLRNEYEYVVKGHSIDALIAALYLQTQGKSVAYLETGHLYPRVVRDHNARILDFGFRFVPKFSSRSKVFKSIRSLNSIQFDSQIGDVIENFKSFDLLNGDIRQTLTFDAEIGFQLQSPSNFTDHRCPILKEALQKINKLVLSNDAEKLTKDLIQTQMGSFHGTFEKIIGIPEEAFRKASSLKEFYSTSFSQQAPDESVFQLSVLQAVSLGLGARYMDPRTMGFVDFAQLLIQSSFSGRLQISTDLFYDRLIQFASSFLPCLTSGYTDFIENGVFKGILENSNGRLIPTTNAIVFNAGVDRPLTIKGICVLTPMEALGHLPSKDGVILHGPYGEPIRYSLESINQAGLTLGSIRNFSMYAKHPESYVVLMAFAKSVISEDEIFDALSSEFHFLGREKIDVLASDFSESRNDDQTDLGHLVKSAELFFHLEGIKS